MPCVGEARVLMIAVSFPDAQHGFSAEEIQNMCFGPEDPQSPRYPVESSGAFYSRSSYGRLNLTGKVYTYTAKYEIDAYTKTNYREPDYRTRDDLDGFHSEYFIVEFNTPTGNDSAFFVRDNRIDLFRQGGVRVLHCNAELHEISSGKMFKWCINSKSHDRTNKKQRVLRIINYRNMYFNDGKVINNETDGFAWYDENGDRTVDPGITITISDFDENTGCKITIASASE